MSLTNEEKKQFLIGMDSLMMKHRPYDVLDKAEIKRREDSLWEEYLSLFYESVPKSLYKYRYADDRSIENLANDKAWFSFPADFDDSTDSALNFDVEAELEKYEKCPILIVKDIMPHFAQALGAKYGCRVDPKLFGRNAPFFRVDGSLDELTTRKYLLDKLPFQAINEFVARVKSNLEPSNMLTLHQETLRKLRYHLDHNRKLKGELMVFCLAEEANDQAMWGLYADQSKGFCIEYVIPKDTFLGQRMLLNLFPVYYGEKPLIRVLDVFVRGIYSEHNVNGMSYEDYYQWFVSTHTKDPSYAFQKEWRITFEPSMGGNLQTFPFAKSIILGERIAKDNAERLIGIAKSKGLSVYQRKLIRTGSAIVTEKIF